MKSARDLLIEIGTEELPPKALKELSAAFSQGVFDGLVKESLANKRTEPAFVSFATPRRLAVLVKNVSIQQPDSEEMRSGPSLKTAFDDNNKPTKAALGFARSCGVPLEELDGSGANLIYRFEKKGRLAAELVPAIVVNALAGLPIPKRMRWGESSAEFVRPVHWVVLLFGKQIIPA